MAASLPHHIKVFVSSPSDVEAEATSVIEIFRQVQDSPAWRGKFTFEIVRWNDPSAPTPMDARLSPQQAVDRGLLKPSDCDLVVVILWGRFGTPLSTPRRSDGSQYLSGTEYEFEEAHTNPNTRILLYRRLDEPVAGLRSSDLVERRRQLELVDGFFSRFKAADGSQKAGYKSYREGSHFAPLFRGDIEATLRQLEARREPSKSTESGERSTADGNHYFSAQEVIIRDHVRGFIHRTVADAAFTDFLASHRRGCFIVEGGPGSGKTAFAAHVVQRRQLVHHFVNQSGGRADLRLIMCSLLDQLARREQCPVLFEGTVARLAKEFDELRARAAARQSPLCIVIDAIDELDDDTLVDLPFLSIDALPDGVYLLLTCRPGVQLDRLRQQLRIVPTVTFHLGSFSGEETRALLHARGVTSLSEEDFEQVHALSGGHPLYLDAAIRSLTDPTTGLGRLPSDIEGFYRQDTERAIVEIEFRDMLGVLAVTRRPLRSHDIAAITGHPQRVIKERCLKPLRHLLREIDEGFSFYHRHFHEFVTREVLYIDELREYHGKIASWLSSKPSPSRDAFLESLAHHLSEAGHPEELASRITGDFLKEKIARFGYAVLEDIELVARALLSIDPSEAVDRCVALVDAVAAGSERFAHDAADTIRFGQAASRDRQMVAPQVPSAGGIDVFAALVPKSAASADFVEVVALGNRLAIAIGDAPGSGLRSAFVARFVATMFREALARGGAEDLSTTLRSIDTALRPHGHFAHVSLLAAVIDPTAGVVTLANAGHPFALRYSSRSDMSDRLLVRGDILNDTVREPVEPWFDTRRYELAAGDILVMVSDGLTEGGRLDDAYGYRFERLLREQRPTTAKDTATSILNDWTIHPRDPDTGDDATIVVAMLPQAKG